MKMGWKKSSPKSDSKKYQFILQKLQYILSLVFGKKINCFSPYTEGVV